MPRSRGPVARAEVHPLVQELRTRRLLRGWSLPYMEKLTGIPDSTISNWETGTYLPPLNRLTVWAAALGLELRLAHIEESDDLGTEDRQLYLLRRDGYPQG